MKEHKYIGQGKEKSFPNGGTVLNCSVCLSDIIDESKLESVGGIKGILSIPSSAIDISNRGSKAYLNFTVSQRRSVSQYGDTHSVYIEEYYMQRGGFSAPSAAPSAAPAPTAGEKDPFDSDPFDDEDEIPF